MRHQNGELTSQLNAQTVNRVVARMDTKKYVLGSTSRILIQALDVNPFTNISNAH